MAGEKRPASADDHGDSKRARSNGTPTGTTPSSIQQQIAAAKARAAAVRGRISAAASGQKEEQKPASPGGPPAAAPASGSASDARAKLEAMKARVAAATARSGAQQQQPAKREPLPEDDGGARARGGLGIGLHPMLAGNQQQEQKKSSFGSKFGTTMGNRRNQQSEPEEHKPATQLDLSGPSLEEIKSNPYYDASLGGALPKQRKSRALVMNEKGRYMMQATALRRQAQLEEMKRRIAESARRADLEVDKSEQAFIVRDIPDVEWWDEGLVDGATYPAASASDAEKGLKISTPDTVVTRYVQHPVLLDAPRDSIPFTPKPMHLTKIEQKKLRRQTRMADLKEKQAKVRLGLEAPAPPKVKKSNLMRVLGEQAVKDPTAVEARVTREIAERAALHTETNESRRLGKVERDEKAKANAAADAARGLSLSVYRIGSLAFGKARAKILMNASQCHDLTGILLTHPACCVLIVEAGAHSAAFMRKLVTRRIDWTENAPAPAPPADDDDAEANKRPRAPVPAWLRPVDEAGRLKDLSDNSCVLLWEGDGKERRFKKWSEKDCETEGEARQALERNKMENMWMMAKNWRAEDDA